MKSNKINTVLLITALVASSCATNGPEHYTPEPYREEASFYKPFKLERVPANFGDCWDSIRVFLGATPKAPTVAINANPVVAKKITEAIAKNPIRYPKGFEEKQGSHIQYGFESEYLHDETEALLKNYMPEASIYKGSKEDWLKLTAEERLAFVDSNVKKIFDTYRGKGRLVKITDDPELSAALPDSFVSDAGHFEIVLDPLDSAEAMIQKIKVINKNLGVGSMQTTISNPIDRIFLKSNKAAREELKAELLGYYNFMNDLDTLSKLETGYERFLKDPKVQAAKSFNHPWLGPMTKLKHDKLEDLIDGIVEGKNYSEEQLKQMSYLVVSHKFIGGLSYRPDVAFKKSRLASEVRDCHQNVKCIEDRIIRETYFLMKGKEKFKSFSNFKQLDTIKDFKNIEPADIQYMLKDLFPVYGSFTQRELELYRNFSYPYRDWSGHIETLGKPGLKEQVEQAQSEYTEKLKSILFEYNAKKLTKAEAQVQTMGALAEFSKKSGLVDAMKEKYNELLDPSEIKHFDGLKFTFLIKIQWPSGESFPLATA